MARATFSKIKKALAKHDRDALVNLVGELYGLNTWNRDFLDTRFLDDDTDALSHYKEIIDEALHPDVMSSDPVSFRDARKAISDYRKALGADSGMAELTVYAAERGNQYTCDYGDIDAPFYDSLVRMYEYAAKTVTALERETAEPFIARLGAIVKKADGMGWGYYDSIAEIFSETFPGAKVKRS